MSLIQNSKVALADLTPTTGRDTTAAVSKSFQAIDLAQEVFSRTSNSKVRQIASRQNKLELQDAKSAKLLGAFEIEQLKVQRSLGQLDPLLASAVDQMSGQRQSALEKNNDRKQDKLSSRTKNRSSLLRSFFA